MGEGDGETLVGEVGRLLVLSASVSFYILCKTGSEQDLGYSLALSDLLQAAALIQCVIVLDLVVADVVVVDAMKSSASGSCFHLGETSCLGGGRADTLHLFLVSCCHSLTSLRA